MLEHYHLEKVDRIHFRLEAWNDCLPAIVCDDKMVYFPDGNEVGWTPSDLRALALMAELHDEMRSVIRDELKKLQEQGKEAGNG